MVGLMRLVAGRGGFEGGEGAHVMSLLLGAVFCLRLEVCSAQLERAPRLQASDAFVRPADRTCRRFAQACISRERLKDKANR